MEQEDKGETSSPYSCFLYLLPAFTIINTTTHAKTIWKMHMVSRQTDYLHFNYLYYLASILLNNSSIFEYGAFISFAL